MSNNKQSSVEYYINNLIDILGDEIINKLTIEQTNQIHYLGNKAVAKHKEEIIKSWKKGDGVNDKIADEMSLKYYNETFGDNNEQS